MVSKVDKIMVHENESLSEVNLLKGVKLIEGGYVCLVGNDGVHKKNSKHYNNEAIDIRTRDMSLNNKVLTQQWIKKWLGFNYDVVLETDHIHIEYDPK